MRVLFGIWDHFERRPNIPANEAGGHDAPRGGPRDLREAEDRSALWPTFEEHWFATPVLVNEEGRAVPIRGASSRAPGLRRGVAVGPPSHDRDARDDQRPSRSMARRAQG